MKKLFQKVFRLFPLPLNRTMAVLLPLPPTNLYTRELKRCFRTISERERESERQRLRQRERERDGREAETKERERERQRLSGRERVRDRE